MFEVAVTQESIEAIKNLEAYIKILGEQLLQEDQKLYSVYEDNKNGLGAKSESIGELLLQLKILGEKNASNIEKLRLRLLRAVAIRQSHIDNNQYDSVRTIEKERRKAVSDAWKREKELVLQGKGTRDWTVAQQAELIKRGKISGYEGQHMKDVKHYPEYAGDLDNIQFLPEGTVHLEGAHGGAYKNGSNGWYDEKTGKVVPFEDDELKSAPIIELTSPYEPESRKFTEQLSAEFGYGGTKREDYIASKKRHKKTD